jgi:hypothetical protein
MLAILLMVAITITNSTARVSSHGGDTARSIPASTTTVPRSAF